MARPESRPSPQVNLLPLSRGGLGGYLLAWAGALSFCSGLLGLAALPPLGVEVPRGLIFGYGAGCALLALQSLLLSRPWQQWAAGSPGHRLPAGWKRAAWCRWRVYSGESRYVRQAG
jgi:hypothetical protein